MQVHTSRRTLLHALSVLGVCALILFGTMPLPARGEGEKVIDDDSVLLIHTRPWRLENDPEQSLFAVGNGRMIAYFKGPDLVHLWGPPYSSPNLTRMQLQSPSGPSGVSSREVGAAVWHHRLTVNGDAANTVQIVDFVDSELPCLVRIIDTRAPLTLLAHTGNARLTDTSSRYPGRTALLCTHPVGTPIYGYRFCSQQPVAIQLMAEGHVTFRSTTGSPGKVAVEIAPGRSVIAVVGGPETPDCLAYTDKVLETTAEHMLNRTREWWRRELGRVRVPEAPADLEIKLAEIAEDVAVNLITQQSAEGAVLAGHNYCLAYVRDQFGVARGLLDLGLHHRARQVLAFYWHVFGQAKVVHNAQTIGGWPYFHVHENDDVEMTAYLIQQAMEYMDRTGDGAFVREIFPMLDWAFRAQTRHLVRNMLPFNGDETYIAGGMLPRSCMDDGSAEATYLFFASGRRLADWAETQGLWSSDRAAEARRLCVQVEAVYRDNFVVDGRLMLNHPARTEGLRKQRFRHGVCQAQQAGCVFFGWLEAAADGCYCCEKCYLVHEPEPAVAARHYLPSVALTPLFIGTPVASFPTTADALDAALQPFRGPDGRLGYGSRRLPGYELGFLLYAMSELNHRQAREMAEHLVALLDPTGAWVEYYDGSAPQGTRYRPWESAINYSALVRYAQAAAARQTR